MNTTSATNRPPITLEIQCRELPDPAGHPGLLLGLVEDKTAVQSVALEQVFSAGKAVFHTALEVALDPQKQTAIFYGPAAHGAPADRFIYLAWQKAL